jgi:hypothetical protein
MDVKENEGGSNIGVLTEFRNRLAINSDTVINSTELANFLLESCSEKSPLLACDRDVLSIWLVKAISNITTYIFRRDFDGNDLLNEKRRSSVFRKIWGLRLSRAERRELQPSSQSVQSKKAEENFIRDWDHECDVILFSAAVAVLFTHNYPVVTECQYTSNEEFTMQFANTCIDRDNEEKVLGINCDETDRECLYVYANLVKIALLCIPTTANKEKIRDSCSRLAQGKKFSRGGGEKAFGVKRRNRILELLGSLPSTPRLKRKNSGEDVAFNGASNTASASTPSKRSPSSAEYDGSNAIDRGDDTVDGGASDMLINHLALLRECFTPESFGGLLPNSGEDETGKRPWKENADCSINGVAPDESNPTMIAGSISRLDHDLIPPGFSQLAEAALYVPDEEDAHA